MTRRFNCLDLYTVENFCYRIYTLGSLVGCYRNYPHGSLAGAALALFAGGAVRISVMVRIWCTFFTRANTFISS